MAEFSVAANACNEGNISEGEGAANSLANGLRLSPESDTAEQDIDHNQSDNEALASNEAPAVASGSVEGERGTSNDADFFTVIVSSVTDLEAAKASINEEPSVSPNENWLGLSTRNGCGGIQ